MSNLSEESIRLLREKWPSADLLAQELFAILHADVVNPVSGPITINAPAGTPAITINQPAGQAPPIQVNRPQTPGGFSGGISYPTGFSGGAGPPQQGPSVRLVVIDQVLPDLLVVHDPADSSFAGQSVAKPPTLQSSAPTPAGVDALAYSASDGQTRIAFYQTQQETQIVMPPWAPGQQLAIAQVTAPISTAAGGPLSGGSGVSQQSVTWIDLNVDARAWAVQIPLDTQTGP